MFYALVLIAGVVASIFLWAWYKSQRARGFAERHGLRSVRGSIDTHTPLRGSIHGVNVRFEPERVNVGNRGRESRVVVTLEQASKEIGTLQRWKSGIVELSVSVPSGLVRADLSGPLAEEYELLLPTGTKEGWTWLKQDSAIGALRGFRALRRVQSVGTGLVFHVRGDLGEIGAMERVWKLLEVLTTKA